MKIGLFEPNHATRGLLLQLTPEGASLDLNVEDPPYHVIFFCPGETDELEGQFKALGKLLHADGVLWAVIPKRRYAERKDVELSWTEVKEAALGAGMVDKHVVALSEEDYATGFVHQPISSEG